MNEEGNTPEAAQESLQETGGTPDLDAFQLPPEIPVVPLRDTVVFPAQAAPLQIGREDSLKAVQYAMGESQKLIGLFTQKSAAEESPVGPDLYRVGTVATILKLLKYPEGNVMVLVKGLQRIRAEEFLDSDGYLQARIQGLEEKIDEEDLHVEALVKNLRGHMQEMFELMPFVPEELKLTLLNVEEPGELADLVVAYMDLKAEEKQTVLEELSVRDRLEHVVRAVRRETEVLQIGTKIRKDVRSSMDQKMREQYLREQLRAIQRELGEGEETSEEIKDLREQIGKADMPERVEEEALKELDRLANIHPSSAEYTVVRTYLDWLVNLPWSVQSEDKLNIAEARRILDEDHYNLQDAKDRILEYLAVRKLAPDRPGPILCFVGPPGTGKTSLGKSISRAMGRQFHRISLGGLRDEAEIRGHRRTYVGALPGRIIQALRKVKTRNPVIMLDEVDKIGADYRGDPAAALLEVLDPQQNNTFLDLYLALPFDLSRVLFITTANTLEPIPRPLLDRMEVIEVSGYTLEEKVTIAREFLVPRQLRQHGLKAEEVRITDDALYRIADQYTREAGVRNLERQIGKVCRKIALGITEGADAAQVVEPDRIAELLGPQRFFPEIAERTEVPGVAVGLAWTPTGGDILFIEATRMPGKGQLTLTGSLGDVMKESAMAALSWLRTHTRNLGVPEDFYATSDIHVHVPAGAIPKDGPSAGVSITAALASILTNRPCRHDVAMTGEITLRGKVMPVGGIKEKILAAKRAGVKEVLLPAKNERDVAKIDPPLLEGLKFHYLETLEQVLETALQPADEMEREEEQVRTGAT